LTDTLLLVDVLSDFSHGDGPRLRASFCEHAAELEALIDATRQAAVPVVYANDHFGDWSADRSDVLRRARAGGAIQGAEGILPRADEPLILKPRYSAFNQTPLQMLLAVHDKCMMMSGQDFAFDHCSRVDVSLLDPFPMILRGPDHGPIDRRVAEQYPELSQRQRGARVQIAYHAIQLRDGAVFRSDVLGLRRVVPHVMQFFVGDGFATDVAIHDGLKSCVAVFDDDIVDG